MAKLIDLDALGIGKCNPDVFNDKGYAKGWNSAIEILQNAPTVDAVPVVRCKDCKYCSPGLTREKRSIPNADLVCAYWDSDGLDANDFCSHGERKGESERRNENAE